MNVGKHQGVTPSHIVAAIAEYTNGSSDMIGKIEMKSSYALVDIENSAVDLVLNSMHSCKIKGFDVTVKLDGGKGHKAVSEKKKSSSRKSSYKTEKKRRTRSDQ